MLRFLHQRSQSTQSQLSCVSARPSVFSSFPCHPSLVHPWSCVGYTSRLWHTQSSHRLLAHFQGCLPSPVSRSPCQGTHVRGRAKQGSMTCSWLCLLSAEKSLGSSTAPKPRWPGRVSSVVRCLSELSSSWGWTF